MASPSLRKVQIATPSSKRSAAQSPSDRRSISRPTSPASPASPRVSAASPSAGYFDIPSTDRRSQVETKSRLFSSLAAGWAGSLSMGVAIGYSLPASRSLGRARGTASVGEGTGQAVFWFDSVLPFGALIGALGSSLVAFILGRRCTLALGSAGSLASWLAISWASADSWYLLTARGALGLCTGVVSLAAPAYIGEIAMAKDRGKQCGAHQTGIAAGIMYTYALGQFIDWSQLALCCAVPSILTAVLLVRAVESPRWLMEQGRRGDAQAALRRLRRYASLADSEFEVIEVIYPKTPMPILHYMLAVVVIVSQQFSGVNVIMQYATGPLQVKFGATAHEDFIFIAVIQLVTTAMCAQLLDLAGRVRPLAVSVTFCTGSMMALGSVYFAAANPAYAMDSTLASSLIFGSKVVFSAAFSAGLGPASWVLAVELAPLRASGFDFGSVCAFYWASALAVVSLFATLGTDPHSLAVLSWVCGTVTFAGGVTTFAFAPDTVGISVESILMEGQGYKPKKKKSDTVEAATSSITPRPDEAKALSQHKENHSRARLDVPAAERGHTAGVESAAEALAEDDDRHQERARAVPDEVLRSGAISSFRSAVASTPSIHMAGSGRQK